MWIKEEIQVTSIFNFFHYVFFKQILFLSQSNLLANSDKFKILSSGILLLLTLSQMTNFSLKEFAHDNFKFDDNGRKYSKRVKNSEGKGVIARD